MVYIPSYVTLALSSLFADDTKCFKIISNPTDIVSLQNALNQTLNWSSVNELFLNESKFLHIHFGKDLGLHNFTINGTTIVRSNSVKDLAISSSGKSSTHCQIIATNAYKTLGLISRTFSMHCTIAKKLLYLTLVQSWLTYKYCSQIWRPHQLKDISILERVQRRATKYILKDYHSSYKCRLIQLDLLPLMYQCELSDLLFL